MRFTLGPVIFFLVVEFCCALPVIKNHKEAIKNEKNEVDVEDHGVNHQENGEQYDPSNPHLRTKWDEERRKKLELLKQFYNRERELESGDILNPFKRHDDMEPEKIHAAEIAEVKRSIAKLTEELVQIDHNRRELFKEYEMQKKFNEHQKEMGLTEEKRAQYHEEQEKLREKHKKHEPLHHPGSKQQLEEVWEEQDHVNQEFDPRTFFNLHDMDGNGVWDQDEVKSLFQKELDKMYQDGVPEDDLIERYEEMERMREHVFKEADIDKNGFINYHEFLKQTQEPEFQKDDGWKGLDEQQIYTQEDYDNYIRYHQQQQAAQANAHAAANGVPPQPNGVNYQQVPPPQHGDPNLKYQQGQVPHPAQYQNQIPQYQEPQGHHQIPAQNQQQQPQVPIHHQQQPPQYQQHQVPQQQQQYQMPPQIVTRDQIPPAQQYQHHVGQQQQQNIPNQPNIQHQQQQNAQQQQINDGHLNAQVAVQNTQNQAPAQQQQQQQQQQQHQQQEQHPPNNVEQKNSHVAPAVVSKVNHV